MPHEFEHPWALEQVEGLEERLNQYGNPPSPADFISAGTAQIGLLKSNTGDAGNQSRQNFDGKKSRRITHLPARSTMSTNTFLHSAGPPLA